MLVVIRVVWLVSGGWKVYREGGGGVGVLLVTVGVAVAREVTIVADIELLCIWVGREDASKDYGDVSKDGDGSNNGEKLQWVWWSW